MKMKKTIIILLLAIPLILFIALFPTFSAENGSSGIQSNNSTNTTQNADNGTGNTSSTPEKVAFIIPHADDETIGAGGTVHRIMEDGSPVHFELMTSGDAVTSQLLTVTNYYGVSIPANATASERKKLIREDSFKQVMGIFGCTSYNIHSFDDGALNANVVFTTMENLYLKEGYTVFYTTTGDGNGDHLACQQGMKMMKDKYPNLKYRQFPIYYYHANRAVTSALTKNYTDVNVNQYAAKKKSAFQVYYNIHTILNTFYPYSDGLYSIGPERIYYMN
jgi:LmbE family N-acetylglucosaminyl deacetylase